MIIVSISIPQSKATSPMSFAASPAWPYLSLVFIALEKTRLDHCRRETCNDARP